MLEKLRAKPVHIKQRVAIIISVVISSVILFVWVSSQDARKSNMDTRVKTVSPTEGIASMLDGFFASFNEKVDSAQNGVVVPVVSNDSATSTFDLSGIVVLDQKKTSK